MMERAGFVHCIVDRSTQEAPAPAPSLQEDNLPKKEPLSAKPDSAKQYSRLKLLIDLFRSALIFLFTLLLLALGVTSRMEETVRSLVSHDYLVLLGFALLFGTLETLLTFPLSYASGYSLEHKFGLSNQTLRKWLWEGLKGMLVGICLTVPLLFALFYFLRNFGSLWWIPVGILIFAFSVLLARIAPLIIFPLFYKFRSLQEGNLKECIIALCDKVGMKISGVFVFDMSKNTKKANAAFTGIGKSKRIVLGDTLIANFTDDEIETVFAHELGHFKLHHLRSMMLIGALSTFAGLFLTAVLYEESLSWFGLGSVDTIAALPLLGLWLGLYSLVTTPPGNVVSRAFEREADRYAIRTTGKKESFINALQKLARVNLADPSPHPLIEFLFHSHPSIEKRIQAVERL
ncbi:MAG: M48 family metallopeptidase [Ignavibacteriales bacterium]|nr:M48 family metallopeptidase [Ignavibacteriales bacterium]